MDAARRAVEIIGEDNLPVPKADFLDLVELCIGFGPFQCLDQYWVQKDGLAMGSPLSAVLATLIMECLEVDSFLPIIGDSVFYQRYVGDCIVVLPRRANVDVLLKQLNGVCHTIHCRVRREG